MLHIKRCNKFKEPTCDTLLVKCFISIEVIQLTHTIFQHGIILLLLLLLNAVLVQNLKIMKIYLYAATHSTECPFKTEIQHNPRHIEHEIHAFPTLIIFRNIHFQLISENEFFHEIKCDRITSFIDYMQKKHKFLCGLPHHSNAILFHKY